MFIDGHKYARISSATTTVVKAEKGKLNLIAVSGNSGTITIYDNTAASGQILAVIPAITVPNSLYFEVAFLTVLTIVTSAACELLVSYQ